MPACEYVELDRRCQASARFAILDEEKETLLCPSCLAREAERALSGGEGLAALAIVEGAAPLNAWSA